MGEAFMCIRKKHTETISGMTLWGLYWGLQIEASENKTLTC